MSDNREPRKATEVIIELENKIDTALGLLRNLEFNISIISNKLNDLLSSKNKEIPKITVETVSVPAPLKVVSPEEALPIEEVPNGFRRTSRPETYSGDNAYLKQTKKPVEDPKFPVQIPRGNKSEVIVPSQVSEERPSAPTKAIKQVTNNSIPVSQRIVDKNGKSVFLADVIIINNETVETVFTTRTNGIGKWSAPLAKGTYTITLRKRDAETKEPIEINQNINVDGSVSPFELPTCIIKN